MQKSQIPGNTGYRRPLGTLLCWWGLVIQFLNQQKETESVGSPVGLIICPHFKGIVRWHWYWQELLKIVTWMFWLIQQGWGLTTLRAGQHQKLPWMLWEPPTMHLTGKPHRQSWELMWSDDIPPRGSLGKALAWAWRMDASVQDIDLSKEVPQRCKNTPS